MALILTKFVENVNKSKMNPQQKKKKKPKKQNDDGDYCPKKHELKNAHTNPNS